MTLKGLNKIGGILMLISLFIPAIIVMMDTWGTMVWMFGLCYARGRFYFGTNALLTGIAFFILILILSILCFIKEPGKTRIFGILSFILVIIYYVIYYISGSQFANATGGIVTVLVIPFIGFFGIIIGSIINILAK